MKQRDRKLCKVRCVLSEDAMRQTQVCLNPWPKRLNQYVDYTFKKKKKVM